MLSFKPVKWSSKSRLVSAVGAVVVGVLVLAFLSYRATRRSLDSSLSVARMQATLSTLEETLAFTEAAETAQRAFLITGQPFYVRDAKAAQPQIEQRLAALQVQLADNSRQLARLEELRAAVARKLGDVNYLLSLRQSAGFEAARDQLASGVGKRSMDRVRFIIAAIKHEQRELLDAGVLQSRKEARRHMALFSLGVSLEVALLVGILALILRDQRRGEALSRTLELARDDAIRNAEMRSQFMSRMSHQVRTPLNAVLGFNGLLLSSSNLPAREREFAESVRESGDVLLTIVNEILDSSRIESGQLLLEPVNFELREMVESVVQMFSERAQAKGLEIGLLWDHILPESVRGDGARIRQVLMNLVSNAVKFTASGDVILTANREAEAHVRFSVTDTGAGITKRDQQRVFGSHLHEQAASIDPEGGTGLGLAIAYDLCELLGGKLAVHSEPGKGSTFWFSIPLQEAPDQRTTEERPHDISAIAGLRVLVVDDAPANRRMLQYDLAEWRLESEEAANAEEALSKLRRAAGEKNRFDLALIDSLMPDVDGVVLCRLIKSDATIASTKIILMTTVAERVEHGRFSALGIEATLTKPPRRSALFDVLVSTVSGKVIAKQRKVSPSVPRLARPDVRILVAEDNSVNQRLALLQLESLGFRADLAGDGAEVLEALARISYDLVLMDCQMPVMNGFEATRELRRRELAGLRVPVIAMTANAFGADRQRCLDAGMDDYVSKPVDVDQLALVLDRWLPEPEEDPIDQEVLASLRKLAATDQKIIADLVSIYSVDSAARLQEMQQAVDARNPGGLTAAAHAFKSSSGGIGAKKVKDLAASIETLGRDALVDGAQPLLDLLKEELPRTLYKLNVLANAATREPLSDEVQGDRELDGTVEVGK